MAVQEQTPLQEYTANGITKQFDLEFDCESADHLIVSIDDLEVLHTDWYLSGSAIMFHDAPANGKRVKIQRNTPFNRLADYQSYNNSFRPPAINKDFDRIWWKLQELGVADWILSNRISALKAYVDDRDDELRAYLLEEIRKQGVALDQLDEYYNYLMERLAQIAVDKGWDASFVVSASGETQQEINDYVGAKWRNKAGGYELNARVMLENGAIVRSTTAANTNNPNSNLQGWVFDSTLLIEYFGALDGFDCSLAVQSAFNYLHSIGGGCVSTNLKNIVISQVCTYHDNTTVDFNGAEVRFINEGRFVSALYNSDKSSFVPATPVESYYTHTATSSVGNPLTTIASDAMRKAQTILVSDTSGFAVGDYIFVSNGYCDMWRVMEKYESEGLPASRSFQDWVRPDVDLWRCEIAKIKNIIGNTIYLEDQLVNDYPIVVKTYGLFSNENSLPYQIGWNTPRIERLGGASNCKFKNTAFVNDGNRYSLIAYASFGVTTQGCTFKGTGIGVEYLTCYASHILDSFSSTANFGQSIRRGSALCTIGNATAEYIGADAPVIVWEGSNLCVVDNIKVDGTKGNVNHAKIGFYFNTCWDCVGSNFTGKNLADVVSVQFCRGNITANNISGVNVGNLLSVYATFDVSSDTGVQRGYFKDSISDYDSTLVSISETQDIRVSNFKDAAKYSNSQSSGRIHIYKSFGVDLDAIDAENTILWNSIDDDKRYDASKFKMKTRNSTFKKGYITQTYNDSLAQTRLSYLRSTDFMQSLEITCTHNTELREVKILGKNATTSLILSLSHFTRLIDCEIRNATNGIDFKGGGTEGSIYATSQIYMRNTFVDAPTKFLNYVDPTQLAMVNNISSASRGIKYISGLTDYPQLKTIANPAGDGNTTGWYLVESPFNGATRSFTTAALSSSSNTVNSPERKWLGCEVYNTTIGKFMKATGSTPTSTWVSTDGLTTITPV